ncbi:AbrB/MazE/SpoVT family DNA-binding domain-containing protein [bacterium]|nr:MAG: AbrB/MazE/SpoVT family DNA-binding domain-containing protein [bacterium]
MVKEEKSSIQGQIGGVRKLTRMGGRSLGLTLPVELISELKWKEKQKVVVKRVRGGILIKDWKKK